MKGVIVGGGIGGLAAGLALARIGWEVEVLERAPALAEIGAGVQISPNGMRALDWLGVSERIEDSLFEPEAISLRLGRSGRKIFRLPMKGYAEARWGARFIQIHRADLHAALFEALCAAGGTVRADAQVTGYVREHSGAAAYLAGGTRVYGDLLIGADGIKSVIRAQMLGADRARFTGNVAWRITVPVDALETPPPPEGVIWSGARRHAVTTRVRGGQMVNFVGIVEHDDWQEEGWSLRGEQEEALMDFAGWQRQICDIIRAEPQPHKWALFDRPPLRTWLDGPVALLGDAAHPMLPSMAQGAVQALEDAVALSMMVEQHPLETALQAYMDARKQRVSHVQARSLANLRMFHKSGFAKLATYGPLWAAGLVAPGFLHGRQDWIYSFDPAQVTPSR